MAACRRPPGGVECASREGAGWAPPLPQLGNGSGLAEPGLEVRTADGLTEGRAGRGEGVGGGGEQGSPGGSERPRLGLLDPASSLVLAFHPRPSGKKKKEERKEIN